MISNQEILRLYTKEVTPNGNHDFADDAEVSQTTMDFSIEAKLDYNDAARSLELAAQQLDVTTNQLVAAVATLRVFTGRGIRDAIWELNRVVNVVGRIHHLRNMLHWLHPQCIPGWARVWVTPRRRRDASPQELL